MIDGYSPVPFADFWAQFPFIESGVRGDFGIADLWAQWNEHRIFVARLQFLLDYGVLEGTNVFLFASIAVSSVLLAALFAIAVWLDTRDWLLGLGTLAVAGTATMSPTGIENLTWSFQVQFVQVFLFAAAAILGVVVAARASSGARRAAASAVSAFAAIAATYSMANGLISWVIMIGLALALRLPRRLTVALAVVGTATVFSFLWHFEFSTRGSHSDPVGLLRFVALYLGNAFWGAGATEAALVGGIGLVLFPLLCAVAWKGRAGPSVALPFGVGVASFVVLTAVQTAVGRLDLGTLQALAPRYSIGSYTFWLGLLVGFLVPLRERTRSLPLAAPVALAGASLIALFVGYRTLPFDSFLRTEVIGRELTVVAYRAGVDDVSQTVPGVQGGPGIPEALHWMERERLGPWAPGGMVDTQRVTATDVTPPRSCVGAIEANEPVPGGRQLRGWIATPDGELTSRNLVVLDGERARRGLGLRGTYRPDTAADAGGSEWSGFVAYVGGEPDTPLHVVLLAPGGETARCQLG